ncbi:MULTISPECIES: nitroreductase family protein [Tsukamurella]|uniref:Nitroreductase family protein n=1 Tax=Tsukamurella strandjordii TaxID=147577 RepID=A0AA90NEV8_9ACTN|nr:MULTISPECIES: nitroreductase family protein [Tsukamurella]MDP0397873.1 nitroreductase family protein [Tsukamurella strandjordii]GIZ99317.1 oxidoreductase [Tsukamurella sp. TY48]
MVDRIPPSEAALARLDMPLVEAMLTQRAIRRVLPDPVDDALVLRCIELAQHAPTGQNGQQWEFVVVKDPRIKERLGRRYRQAWNFYWRTTYRRIAAADDSKARMAKAVQWQVDHFTEIPVLVVACLRLGVGEGRVPVVRMPHVAESGYWGSIYPAVQNLLLAARAMGLGASLITMPLWNLLSARRILGLPAEVTPVCIVPLGWPRGRYGPSARTPVGDVTHLDSYGRRRWLRPQP